MAAIPDSGGAGYAPGGVMRAEVMRALMRVAVLGGLLAAAWLLGSGTSHADEDIGQPGTDLIHVINAATSSDSRSGDRLGVPPPLRPILESVPTGVSVPRSPIQPPVRLGILRPIVNALSVAKPLTHILSPVSRPLAGTAPQHVAARPAVPVEQPVTVPAPAPVVTAAVSTPAPRTLAVPVHTAAHNAAPAGALGAPAQLAADPMTVPVATGDDPAAPMPVSPPGSTTSPCMIGGAGGSAGTKNASAVAVREGWAVGSPLQPHELRARDTSDLPRSLSAQPSTSPD